ncbi:MAG: 50S ribosomal protein L17 [Isosphaeraceae bacterium]|nr:50S ribosomal protein L17 [Isosphaeraceae bacterium]
MRHLKAGRKFKRSPSHRRMMLRNLATALIEHGRIQTTLAKAKELQPFVEKLITLAKDGWNLNNFRRINAVLTQKSISFKLIHDIGPTFAGRPGGYTRIYKLAKVRQGDAAPLAVIALLGADEKVKPRAVKPVLTAAPAPKAEAPAAEPTPAAESDAE